MEWTRTGKTSALIPSGSMAQEEMISDMTKGKSTTKIEPTESKSNISQKTTKLSRVSKKKKKKSSKDERKLHKKKRNSKVGEPIQKKKTQRTIHDFVTSKNSFQTDVNNEPQKYSNIGSEKVCSKNYTSKTKINSNSKGTIVELQGDLFESDERYSLAHCVAEDMSMGSGIAVEFKNKFRKVGYLLDQQIKTGGVAVLKKKKRFIYYLVTKARSNGKPRIESLAMSLKAMKNHALKYAVKEIAMPTIGCGLDRLDWEDVRALIQDIFKSLDITIFVYHFPGGNPTMYKFKKQSAYIKHLPKELVNLGKNTARFYIGNTSNEITPEMKSLDKSYNFIREYLKSKRSIKDVIEIKGDNYDSTFGFICKDNNVISYKALERCLATFKEMNEKHAYRCVGIQAFTLDEDSLVMAKLESVLKNCLAGYNIMICRPAFF